MSRYELVHLYALDGSRQESVALAPLLKRSLEPFVGECIQNARILCTPLNQRMDSALLDPDRLESRPRLLNLDPEWNFLLITVEHEGEVIYHHAHTVDEVIGRPLEAQLDHLDEAALPLGYSLRSIRVEIERRRPAVQGEFALSGRPRQPHFRMRPIPDPPLPLASLEDWKLTPPADAASSVLTVILHEAVAQALYATLPLSEVTEEGGFLVGYAYRDRDHPGRYLLEVIAAPPAEHTGGSLLHLEFTGDSFAHIKRQLAHDYGGAALLGWYHTHLFPATASFGLSTIDVNLHRTTFKRPWQVAGLINVDHHAKRTLRFYGSDGEWLSLCPFVAAATSTSDSAESRQVFISKDA